MNIEDTHLACCTNPHEQKKNNKNNGVWVSHNSHCIAADRYDRVESHNNLYLLPINPIGECYYFIIDNN